MSFKGMGMVQALSETLEVRGLDQSALQYCSAILLNMSTHEGLCKDLYEDGAVLYLVSLARVRMMSIHTDGASTCHSPAGV